MELFRKLAVIKEEPEFDEFREWAIEEGLMRLENRTLALDSGKFSQLFLGLEQEVDTELDAPDVRSEIEIVSNKIIKNIVKAKLESIGVLLRS